MGFSRQEYWSGLPILIQRIFPTAACNAAIFPIQPGSPALQAGSYLSSLGSPYPGRAESKSVCLGQITSFSELQLPHLKNEVILYGLQAHFEL